MRKQYEEDRDKLINQLQQKLNQLKNERSHLLEGAHAKFNKNKSTSANDKIKVSDYLQQNGINVAKGGKSVKKQLKTNAISQEKVEEVRVMQEVIPTREEKQQTKQRLKELQALYQQKRELESIGIYQNNEEKIRQMRNTQKISKQIEKQQTKSVQMAAEKKRKQEILKEQLLKAEKFLKQNKNDNKALKKLQHMHYTVILQKETQKLREYHSLLTKKSLNILQKDKLLTNTFDILKQQNGVLQKVKLKQFLLGNKQFCQRFFISKNQIYRDLEVHQCKEEGYLSYSEFYEFIKAIELTNPILNPNLKNDQIIKKMEARNNIPQKNSKKQRQNKQKDIEVKEREGITYLQKLFNFLDSTKQKILQRQKLQISLEKCHLFDESKAKSLKKEDIISFGSAIKKMRIKVIETDYYYKGLDIKYIGIEQLFDDFKKFIKKISKGTTNSLDSNENEGESKEIYHDQEGQQESEGVIQIEIKKEQPPTLIQQTHDLTQDFKKYGWKQSNTQNQHAKFQNLNKFDKFYRNLQQKNANQIAWNGIDRYKQDFTRFDECIKELNRQMHK